MQPRKTPKNRYIRLAPSRKTSKKKPSKSMQLLRSFALGLCFLIVVVAIVARFYHFIEHYTKHIQ